MRIYQEMLMMDGYGYEVAIKCPKQDKKTNMSYKNAIGDNYVAIVNAIDRVSTTQFLNYFGKNYPRWLNYMLQSPTCNFSSSSQSWSTAMTRDKPYTFVQQHQHYYQHHHLQKENKSLQKKTAKCERCHKMMQI